MGSFLFYVVLRKFTVMKKFVWLLLVVVPFFSLAQSIGIGTISPDNSAQLDIRSTSKGLLIPRMTDAQMRAIVLPAKGLMVFNDTDSSFYMHRDSGWVNINSVTGIGGWSITGNSAVDTSKNFIGTTDNKAIVFKVNNKKAGVIQDIVSPYRGNTALGAGSLSGGSEGSDNTVLGAMAMNKAINGSYNVAVGRGTLGLQTISNGNTAVGAYCLDSSTGGIQNTAMGYLAMHRNTSGRDNVAIGIGPLYSNTSGNSNVAIGFNSLALNETGGGNTSIGALAMVSNISGIANVAVGATSLYSNTSGIRNVAIGNRALYSNTEKSYLVAIGDSALFNNGLNASPVTPTEATNNTAVGSKALFKNTRAEGNTGVGNRVLENNKTGNYNTAMGVLALSSDSLLASANTAVGAFAGRNNNGSQNTFIGFSTGQNATTGSRNIMIGANAGFNAKSSDKLYIGNTNADSLGIFIYGDMAADSLRINANTTVTGYSRLGTRQEQAPAIKIKKLTTTSASTQTGSVTVAHGLNRDKILSIQVLLSYVAGAADIPGSYLDVPGYEYNWQVNNTNVWILNKNGNSANILSKPVKILIVYEE